MRNVERVVREKSSDREGLRSGSGFLASSRAADVESEEDGAGEEGVEREVVDEVVE